MAVLDAADEQHRPQGRPHPAGRRRARISTASTTACASPRCPSCGPCSGRWRGTPFEPEELAGLERIRDGLDGDLGASLRGLLSAIEVRATRRRLDGAARRGTLPAPLPDLAGDPLAAVLTVIPAASAAGLTKRRTPGGARYAPEVRMRRWNGWGEDHVTATLAPAARDLLERTRRPGHAASATRRSRTSSRPSRRRDSARTSAWTSTPPPASATRPARACPTGSRALRPVPRRPGRRGTPGQPRRRARPAGPRGGARRAAHPVRRRDQRGRRGHGPAGRRPGHHAPRSTGWPG